MSVVAAPVARAVAGPAAPAAPAAVDPAVAEAARGFEGVFLSMLAGEMFKGTDLASAQPIYGGLATQAFGDALAASGGLGLAAMLTRQIAGAS